MEGQRTIIEFGRRVADGDKNVQSLAKLQKPLSAGAPTQYQPERFVGREVKYHPLCGSVRLMQRQTLAGWPSQPHRSVKRGDRVNVVLGQFHAAGLSGWHEQPG